MWRFKETKERGIVVAEVELNTSLLLSGFLPSGKFYKKK